MDVILTGSRDSTVLVKNIAEDTVRNIENAIGGGSDDFLVGDESDNILEGGMGEDVLHGAGRADIFAYNAPHDTGIDGIHDLISTEGNKISFNHPLHEQNAEDDYSVKEDQELSFSGATPGSYSVWYEDLDGSSGLVKVDTDGELLQKKSCQLSLSGLPA